MASSVARLTDIDEMTDGRCPWRPVRHHFGITSFGVNAWTGNEVGDRIVNEHDEADEHEELYLVHSGRARFEIDGETVDAPAGTFVFVPPNTLRTAFAEEPDTTIVVVGGAPGKPYELSGWELWAPFRELYEAGDYGGVADRAQAIADAEPAYPMPLYNLACCESLAGRPADAVAHLRRAVELAPQARDWARSDSDFDAIRDDPAFEELVGS